MNQIANRAEAPRSWAEPRTAEWTDQLCELLRIPSVSTRPEHADDCCAAAEWIAADMRRIGLTGVEVCQTEGHPVVYGEWLGAGTSAPTVLLYGHYDVQPPEPLEEWVTPPFEPAIRDGRIHARGAADDKGQLFIHLKAIESWLTTEGHLPVNVKLMIEGEEECGAPSLGPWISANRERLACDALVISDTHMLGSDSPSIVTSLRGMSYCEVEVRGPGVDLHSGAFGGGVTNPAEALARMIASCRDDNWKITIPGFWDDVIDPTPDERAEFAATPFDESEFLDDAGTDTAWGEPGWTTYERVGIRPTFEINGIWGGYIEEGAKTVLPATAHAKISMRLVPNQDWKKITESFERHLREVAPPGVSVTVTPHHGTAASVVPTDTPTMQAAIRAVERVWGVRPSLTREGGGIPVVTLVDELLGISTVLLGFGLPDDRLHSPNERFAISQLQRGIQTMITFFDELGT